METGLVQHSLSFHICITIQCLKYIITYYYFLTILDSFSMQLAPVLLFPLLLNRDPSPYSIYTASKSNSWSWSYFEQGAGPDVPSSPHFLFTHLHTGIFKVRTICFYAIVTI